MAFEQHIAVVKRFCPSAKIIFDVGACTGIFSKQFLAHWPDAIVYAFEPDHRCLTRLEKIRERNNRLVIVPKCVGDHEGNVTFHGCAYDLSLGTTKPPRESRGYKRGLVPMTTVDDQCRGMDRVDILKVDVQGAELEVLQGATNMLETVRVVVVELMFYDYVKGTAPWWATVGLLHEYDLQLCWLFPAHREIDGIERLSFADAIFVRMNDRA